MVQDASQIKERILSALRVKGPSFPVHISTDIGTTILFASAFLSELVSEKRVKTSYMRVGSSPIYFLNGQESSLEKFSQYLRSREKEALSILKEKRFLVDKEQSPAIRVALREIRDFAIPFNKGEEVIWRYFLVPEEEFVPKEEKKLELEIKKEILPKKEEITLGTSEKEVKKEEKPKKKEKKEHQIAAIKKKKTIKKDDKFFSKIKEFLSENSLEMLDIESFGKKEITIRVRDKEKEKILVAYNKNKIIESDVINASKKASESGLPYIILGLGGPLKKLDQLIDALKNLSSIEKAK